MLILGPDIGSIIRSLPREDRDAIARNLRKRRAETKARIASGELVRVWHSGVVNWELNMIYEGRRVIAVDRANGLLTLEQ